MEEWMDGCMNGWTDGQRICKLDPYPSNSGKKLEN